MPTSLLEDTAFEAIINLALMALFNAVPFLGWPGISLIVGFIVTKVGRLVFDQIVRFIDFKAIDWKIGAQNDAYKAAVIGLQSLPPTATEAQIDEAKKNFKETLRGLIRLNQ